MSVLTPDTLITASEQGYIFYSFLPLITLSMSGLGFLLNIGLEAGLVSLPPRQTEAACLEVPTLTSFLCLSWFMKLFDCLPLFHLCLAWQPVKMVLP